MKKENPHEHDLTSGTPQPQKIHPGPHPPHPGRIDLGETIRKRIIIFPAFEDEPKQLPPSYGLFPEFTVTGEQIAGNLEYRYPVSLVSASSGALKPMTDRAINVGLEPIEADDWEFWLYATDISPILRVRGKPLFETRIIYVFRARRVYFAPAEAPSGSIAEIPKELAPEDLEKKESKEEVKNG